MGSVAILVCDECHALGEAEVGADIHTFNIASDERKARVDLCPEHAKPLEDLLLKFG